MTIRWTPTRREWLVSAAAAAAGLVSLGLWRAPGAGRAASASERWLGTLRSIESAAVVGREYLERAPHEKVRARLQADLDAAIGAGDLTDAGIRKRIGARVRADYAAGDTVRLRGWILSRTEARLCALAALTLG